MAVELERDGEYIWVLYICRFNGGLYPDLLTSDLWSDPVHQEKMVILCLSLRSLVELPVEQLELTLVPSYTEDKNNTTLR